MVDLKPEVSGSLVEDKKVRNGNEKNSVTIIVPLLQLRYGGYTRWISKMVWLLDRYCSWTCEASIYKSVRLLRQSEYL